MACGEDHSDGRSPQPTAFEQRMINARCEADERKRKRQQRSSSPAAAPVPAELHECGGCGEIINTQECIHCGWNNPGLLTQQEHDEQIREEAAAKARADVLDELTAWLDNEIKEYPEEELFKGLS